LGDELILLGTGFGIVMSVLAALWGVCSIVGTMFIKGEGAKKAKAAAAAPAVPAAAPAPQIAEGTPPAHVAAIAAAVASLSGRYRIVRVVVPAHDARAWAAQGRYEQQAKWPSQPHAIERMTVSKR
jgi:Na+-transporting methylmalonyl-CoA/oxaloacetate decarboxylase gamma subunit